MVVCISCMSVAMVMKVTSANKYEWPGKMRPYTWKRKTFCFSIVYLNIIQVLTINEEVLKISQPIDCRDNEYFDTLSFSCIQCDINKNLVPSSDRLRCVCNKFSKMNDFKNGHPVCTSCGPNATVTVDGKECVSCKNMKCECPANQIQIDRYSNGTLLDTMNCFLCPNDTYPSLDRSKCLPCNTIAYKHHANCSCPMSTHVRVQHYCLNKDDLSDWLDVRSTYLIKFEKEDIDSYYFRTELQAATYFCKKKNRMACEHLSNMCALSLYGNGALCMAFMQKHISPIWLFYDKEETTTVLNSNRISYRYSLLKDSNKDTLNFTIATFSLDGNFQSISRPSMPCNLLKHIRFGINFSKKCKLTVKDLLDTKMVFMSPYITYEENEEILSHALPVLIKNINENTNDVAHWKLVRKFFLVDNLSGFKALPSFVNGRFKKESNLSALRYMKSLNILVNVQKGKDRGKIFPPILIIEYGELTNEEIIEDVEVTLDYTMSFTFKDSNIDHHLEITIGILSGLAFLFSGIKTWSYCKRNYIYTPSITILFWFFIYAVGAIGNMIILSSIGLCIYLFIFYKGQTVPYILLPDGSNERTIRICTAIAFCFKVIEMAGFIYQYWNVNIFFIDWEQPRTIHNQLKYDSPRASLCKLYSKRFTENEYKCSQTPSEIIAAKRKRTPRKSTKDSCSNQSDVTDRNDTEFSAVCSISRTSNQETNKADNVHNAPISIWRTYFIANQWLKLQTKRKINIILHSIVILCTFQIVKLYSWTLAIPELTTNQSSEDKHNFTLYYAVCTLMYICIYCVQWLVSIAFYERFVKNRMQEFVDLCSIANISIFILPFNYYGFYIHGRSVHGYADTDLPTLIENLEKEENSLCAHRGLLPGTTEQTFILSLTETFKNAFNEYFKPRNMGRNKFLKRNQFTNINRDPHFDRRCKLNQFLCEFVDHCYKDEDYVIKEQHFLERLCDIVLYSAKEKSVFHIDTNHSFDQVLFFGNEWLFAMFEITLFAFIIALCEDCILASVITVLISVLLIIVTKYSAKNNISNKALLDKRFLM